MPYTEIHHDIHELHTHRAGRWYFGGLASATACCFTHPLDLIKVHLQTQQRVKYKASGMAVHIYRTQGGLALYNGLSASICRQMSYSLTRFGLYETIKGWMTADDPSTPLPFYQKVMIAAGAGACGGLVGAPADMINVRMQNDIKLAADKRRNYKHAFDGLWKVYRYEGFRNLFNGASMATVRAILMTVGQLSLYDQFKQTLLTTSFFNDNIITHFTASIMAGFCATLLTQPTDVMKTRLMNAPPGQYKNMMDCFVTTAKVGPLGFYKGFVPAFVRLAPHTILTFIFFEQLRLHFGIVIYINNNHKS
ncbi:mitochondrial dicarboxylate carrier-like [Patiria miniata]|uniref:Mitochondrial dicarboxylate carrier n=1 Tax=Patiria miniata TaxID=46514 RepID=A0A914B1T5_PATMI|nr:mitochondrial dicarboxylate carrier-like [Patiria miniata]